MALAERGAISKPLAEYLSNRADQPTLGPPWPNEFREKLAAGLTEMPPSMLDWAGKGNTKEDVPFRVNYRENLDDVPAGIRGAFEMAQAVTVNHARIEFFKDRFPTAENLRHETTHLAWYDLTRGRYDRFGGRQGDSPAGKQIDEAIDEAKQAGNALVAFAQKAKTKEAPPAPEGVDPDKWFWIYRGGREIRKTLQRLRRYQKKGELTSQSLKGTLEINLMVPDDNLVKMASYLGFALPSAQYATIALFHGYAEKLGVALTGDYAEEEVVAYRAGIDKAFADRLFASIAPPREGKRYSPDQPRVPAGSPDGGQFAGGGGASAKPAPQSAPAAKPKQKELWPGKFPPPTGPKEKVTLDKFSADKVTLNSTVTLSKQKAEKFLEQWNSRVQDSPAEFKKHFLGGLEGTMNIGYPPYGSSEDASWTISGQLEDEDGVKIGEYNREIDWRENKAESAYFKLKDAKTGGDIGKRMLAANVAMYRQLGLDRVDVHADIDVGGYAWAKYGYVPTKESWRDLSSQLGEKIDEMAGGGGYTPESWEELTDAQQERIRDAWKEATADEFLQSEIENWRESGQALEEAKKQLAQDVASGPGQDFAPQQWALDALAKWRQSRGPDAPRVPFTDAQIFAAVTIDYDGSRYGDGKADPDITFDDGKLAEPEGFDTSPTLPGVEPEKPAEKLTQDMRDGIEKALIRAFNDKAERLVDDMEPPDSLKESVDDFQNESWDSMPDRDKFRWAENNDKLPEAERGSGDIDEETANDLRALADSDDPKAIWAIADAGLDGKNLLLGTDWYGTLDFHDEESMKRFNAYVGKQHAAA